MTLLKKVDNTGRTLYYNVQTYSCLQTNIEKILWKLVGHGTQTAPGLVLLGSCSRSLLPGTRPTGTRVQYRVQQ